MRTVSPAGKVIRSRGIRCLSPVQQGPAAEVEGVRAGVEQGDGLALRCGADGVDQGRDNAHEVIRLRRPGDGVSGLIVGVPALALKR